jgi:hypothetical protein
MRSTDCTSAYDVSDTDIGWPERAWGYTYLGWTEDLNGVVLPIDPTPPPEEDDMPEFVNVHTGGLEIGGAENWHNLDWENVQADSDDIASEGNPGLNLGGRLYVATLHLRVTTAPGGRPIRTRTLEGAVVGDEWVTNETGHEVEHIVTTGDTYLADTRAGKVSGKGNRLRWQVQLPAAGTIVKARCELVAW